MSVKTGEMVYNPPMDTPQTDIPPTDIPPTDLLLHICPASDWREAQAAGEYRPASLDTEGFIHCSTPAQVVSTANRFYHGRRALVLLVIDIGRIGPEVRYEAADGSLFPHVYGPLNLEAVVEVHDFEPDETGAFSWAG